MMQFIPPGYVETRYVIEVVATQIFPDQETETPASGAGQGPEPAASDPETGGDPFAAAVKSGLKSNWAAPLNSNYKPYTAGITDEEEQKLVEVLHALRALLYEQKLTAFYADTLFGGGIRSVPRNFWLDDVADRCLACGVFAPLGLNRTFRGETPLLSMFFKAGDVEVALSSETSGQVESQQNGGRPAMQPEVLSAYNGLYPNGHVVLRHSWKQARLAVEEKIGKSISMATLKRAVAKGTQN